MGVEFADALGWVVPTMVVSQLGFRGWVRQEG